VDDPGKLYRQRRRATQAKGLEILDPKAKVEGPSKSPRESPPLSKDAGRPFKIKRRMEKMEIEKEAQHLKAVEARSTCKDCEEYDHVHGKPRFNASSSIQDLVSLCTQLKDFMDEQAKINKDVVTKFKAMEKKYWRI
jgi:hypothetical protein